TRSLERTRASHASRQFVRAGPPASLSSFVKPLRTHMKTIVISLVSLLLGIALGWYVGYARPNAKANREAIKQFAIMDADDSMAAAVAVRAISLIQSGESQKAVEGLVRPVGRFYRYR